MAKILYLSCHEVLEHDEVKLLTELGHEVFSMGAYQTGNAGGALRGPIPNLYDNQHLRIVSLGCSKENLHPELIDWCDIIIMMHNSRVSVEEHPQPWLANNWDKIKHKKVVWRSIGQSTGDIELSLKEFAKDGLKIVRYSPREESIPGFAGCDHVIRFYKDPDEYYGYVGSTPRIVNVSQSMFGGSNVPSRGDHMGIEIFKQVVEGFNWKIFGPDNENAGDNNGGMLNHDDMKQMLRYNRVYFYTGTRPASYTLAGMEAMMTGIPIVSIGPVWGNSVYTNQRTFEMHEIIGNDGECGFWSDGVDELKKHCQRLLEDQDLALKVGLAGRARAIETFGKALIMDQWDKFLNSL